MAKNESLQKARDAKNDEFYTQLNDIANELKHYKEHFKGKTVLCNCDDPRLSNFFHYFSYNFEQLGLKRLITTCYKNQERDLFSRNDSEKEIGIHELKGDGDFRSEECIALLKSADIVVTNPPFSLFREYVAQLIAYDKKFLIIGNQNAITYKEIFALLKSDKLWLGYTKPKLFQIPQNAEGKSVKIIDGKKFQQFGNVCYFTNLDNKKRHEDLILYKTYSSEEYPKYDNFDAINVDKVTDIPLDYDDVMGVPVTFLDKYNPEQFEIIGNEYDLNIEKGRGYINGKRMYSRIFIRRRK